MAPFLRAKVGPLGEAPNVTLAWLAPLLMTALALLVVVVPQCTGTANDRAAKAAKAA